MDAFKRCPAVSVVICTYNRADLLEKTLMSLLELNDLALAEIIVVDNRSTDHTAATIKRFTVAHGQDIHLRYHYEREQGLSAARNAGITLSRAEVIAFLDDDAIPCVTWLQTIMSTFGNNPELTAMGGKIDPLFETERPGWLTGPLELPYTIIDLGKAIREYPPGLNPFGANMAMRKTAFAAVMFPLHLGRKGDLLLSGEESWVFEQIRKNGGTIMYHPHMAVKHFVPAARLTKEWIMNRYYCQGMSHAVQAVGLRGNVMLMAKTAAKWLYNTMDSLLARTEGRKLLNRCRFESIRGTLDTLRNRKSESAAG
ncbi:glycosyltransferase [Paenibacillus maysiensis]|uniref:glycosyltransferase n=1 Tax=Paenibacillus maysiensis TaxID=1155954 RepID=UPI00046E7CC5|nr:glycosyltransferase [Paenibacillus maysiensis]